MKFKNKLKKETAIKESTSTELPECVTTPPYYIEDDYYESFDYEKSRAENQRNLANRIEYSKLRVESGKSIIQEEKKNSFYDAVSGLMSMSYENIKQHVPVQLLNPKCLMYNRFSIMSIFTARADLLLGQVLTLANMSSNLFTNNYSREYIDLEQVKKEYPELFDINFYFTLDSSTKEEAVAVISNYATAIAASVYNHIVFCKIQNPEVETENLASRRVYLHPVTCINYNQINGLVAEIYGNVSLALSQLLNELPEFAEAGFDELHIDVQQH